MIHTIYIIDFGVDELIDFKKNTKFPWLMSNVKDKLTQTLLADGVQKIVAEWHGHKVQSFFYSSSKFISPRYLVKLRFFLPKKK